MSRFAENTNNMGLIFQIFLLILVKLGNRVARGSPLYYRYFFLNIELVLMSFSLHQNTSFAPRFSKDRDPPLLSRHKLSPINQQEKKYP